MADTGKKKHGFVRGMVIYALVFLLLGAAGLGVLWDVLKIYEQTRPETAVRAYEETLTAEYAADRGLEVREQVDGNLQSEEQVRKVILDALDRDITCIRKGRESTREKLVYALRCGPQVIGEFSMEAGEPLRYGMRPWMVTGEHFDFSYLLTEPQSLTVPHSYTVSVNGQAQTEEYRSGTVPYESLKEFSEEYPVPRQVTYTFGPLLGQPLVEIADDLGNPAQEGQVPDYNRMFNTASGEDQGTLDDFTDELIHYYVAFLGSSKNTRVRNYHKLIRYVEKDSELAQRLYDALDGLQYGWSVKHKVASLVTHYQMQVEEGLWLCDVTYEVDTTGQKGVVRTATNARLLIVDTEDGPKLRTIEVY